MTEGPPKSAVELAMERLARKDAEEGRGDASLTGGQKKALAEIRSVYEARLAEKEILHKSELLRVQDPEARAALEENYRRDRERLVSERDGKLEAARKKG
jgi:hypothetical protein